MINLIPPEGHKGARYEYIFRVSAALALLFGGVALCLAAALIPTYVFLGVEKNKLEAEMQAQSKKQEALNEVTAETEAINTIIGQLRKSTSTVSMVPLIAEVERLAPQGIVFKNFSIDASKGAVVKMQVQGIAPTREVLAKFKGGIESSSMFLKAEIPIADLARSVDVPFAITITVAKSK